MQAMASKAETIESALRRAMGYALLARALAYPDDRAFTALQDTARFADEALAGTPLEQLNSVALVAKQNELEDAHIGLFTLSSSPDCPMFETAFLSTEAAQQTARMADIAGFYRAFGVDPASPGFRPDDLCVELEFMGYLCRKQAHAAEHMGAPRVKQVLRAQRMFLREHLGRWGIGIGRRIALRSLNHPFYRTAGEALEDWLRIDCESLGVGHIDMVEAPQMEWVPPEADQEFDDGTSPLIGVDEIPVV